MKRTRPEDAERSHLHSWLKELDVEPDLLLGELGGGDEEPDQPTTGGGRGLEPLPITFPHVMERCFSAASITLSRPRGSVYVRPAKLCAEWAPLEAVGKSS